MPWVINPFTGGMEFQEIKSDPPEGSKEVRNIYVSEDGNLVVEYME